MITVLIPAHNEEESLAKTIESVQNQTYPVDHILVVSDNSTDETVSVAQKCGVHVMQTTGNTKRKAGALNQALEGLIILDGLVLVMDADTILTPTWIESALHELEDPTVGGVGAVFFAGPEARGWLGSCQKLEWVRYAEEGGRTGKTFVMSGTAALIRVEALQDVHDRFGHWYDEDTITEDSRLSIDLKLCGWKLKSPNICRTITEHMPDVKSLWMQRRRWYLGAMQNVADVGLNRITAPYWGQQVMLAISVMVMGLYLGATAWAVATGGLIVPTPFWLGIGFIFATERVITVWDEPLRYKLLAASVFPELLYALVLQSAYLGAVLQKVTKSTGTWTHLSNTRTRA